MARKPTNTRMNDELRKMIQKDIANGKTQTQVSKWYGVGANNVRYAVKSRSMEEYYELQRSERRKKPEEANEKDEVKPDSKTVVVSYDMAVDMAKQMHNIMNEQEIQSTSLTEILVELMEIKNILKKYMEV